MPSMFFVSGVGNPEIEVTVPPRELPGIETAQIGLAFAPTPGDSMIVAVTLPLSVIGIPGSPEDVLSKPLTEKVPIGTQSTSVVVGLVGSVFVKSARVCPFQKNSYCPS